MELMNCEVTFNTSNSDLRCSCFTTSKIACRNEDFRFVSENGEVLDRKGYELRCYKLQRKEMEADGWNYENYVNNLQYE